MKIKTTLVLFVVIRFALASELPQTKVTMADAKARAIQHNASLQALRQSVTEKRAAKDMVRAPYFPRLGAAAGGEAREPGSRAGMAYLYAEANLFNGFRDHTRVRVADIDVEIAEVRLAKAEFRVALDIEQGFLRYSLVQRILGHRRDGLTLNATLKGTARRRRSTGLVSESDIMEFDIREALLQSEIAEHEQEGQEARLGLRALVGSEADIEFETFSPPEHRHIKPELKELLATVREQNENVIVVRRQTEQADAEASNSIAGWLPQLDLKGQAGYLDLERRNPQGGTSVWGLALLKWEFFSGFQTQAVRAETFARRERLSSQYRQGLLDLASQLEGAYRRLKTMEKRVHLEEENRTRAQRYYDSVLSEYKRGVKNSPDMRSAADGLIEARVRRDRYGYELELQRNQLERLLGTSVETEKRNGLEGH